MSVVFVDCETTALDRDIRQVWEVALLTSDDYFVWNLPVDLSTADPVSLGMNGFHDRYNHFGKEPAEASAALRVFARSFAGLTRGAHLVGACVNFDEVSLWKLLRDNGECPMWHYHIIDVEALAAGFIKGRQWGLAEAARSAPSNQRGDILARHGRLLSFDPTPPWKSDALSLAVGVDPDDFTRPSVMPYGRRRSTRRSHKP